MTSRGLFPFTKERVIAYIAIIVFAASIFYLNHIKVIGNFLFGLIGAIFGVCVIILVVLFALQIRRKLMNE
jgi:hypothetical protein